MNLAIDIVLALAAAGFVFRLLRGPSLADRVVAMNGLVVVLMGVIAAEAVRTGSGAFLPTLVALSLVAPVGNGMVARYIERRAE